MDLGYAGRRVVVVGASAGIGFATAQMLAAEGAEVLMASRDPAGIAAAADRIAAATGRRPATAVADITVEPSYALTSGCRLHGWVRDGHWVSC